MSYNASDIEVLSGLEPVRRRPGMYTDISRPNHLAHEVIDNSVDTSDVVIPAQAGIQLSFPLQELDPGLGRDDGV